MKKRFCRQCGTKIPNWFKIDGIRKNLRSRKFCLTCSPFRGHNTKTGGPDSPNKHRGPYANWSDAAKKQNKDCIYKRGRRRKKKLVELAGGSCKRCSYKKNMRALSFHHRDPSKKKFGLTLNNLWSKNWETILTEFKKCDMYCLNCHAEIEDEIKLKDPNYYVNLFDIK